MCGFFLANFPCWMDFYLLRCALFSLFDKKTTQKFADYKFSCTFATAIENETIGRLAQLVQSICLTSRGSAVRIRQRPLNEFLVNHCFFFLGRLAQLVQSICLTSRGSAVRIRQRPPPKRKIIRAFSSAGSEHLPYKQRVGGSNPSTPTIEKIVWFPDSLFLFRNQRVYPRFQKLFQSKLTSLQFPISSATRGQRSDDLTRTYQVLLYTSR